MTDIPTWKQKLEQQYINLAFDPAAALSDLSKKDSIEMRYEDENIWLTQRMMSTLYDVGLPTINEHSNIIFK